VRLLIAEKGAEVQGTHAFAGDCDEVVVVRQFEAELPIALFLRVLARISGLLYSGRRVAKAVLVMAPLLEPALSEARRMLGLTILSHVQSVGEESELVLAIDANASADVRREITELVASWVAHPGTRHARIRVCFSPAPRSAEPPRCASGACLPQSVRTRAAEFDQATGEGGGEKHRDVVRRSVGGCSTRGATGGR